MSSRAPVVGVLKQLRVAGIMDQFTFRSFEHECELLQLTPQGWLTELAAFEPDLLFIESAWRGRDNLWDRRLAHLDDDLIGIVEWCRHQGVPTVFWNKEDPIHFTTFLNTAALFDFVFTTDFDCVHRYKEALGHDRVYLSPFACQPRMFNPLELGERIDAFSFAGAYYVRYPDRARDLRDFISELTKLRPFLIYDRNQGVDDPNYAFPSEFRPFILGHLPFEQVQRAYKGYRYAINLNSVTQSQSMCARRVFELLASNTIAISNYSRGVRLMFGDLVISTSNGREAARRVAEFLDDDGRRRRFRLAGLRKTLAGHTYEDRLAYIWSKVTSQPVPDALPDILVVGHARNAAEARALLASFQRQSYRKRRLLLVAPDGDRETIQRDAPGTVVVADTGSSPLESGRFEGFVAGMVAEDYYGPNYLMDLALATRFSDAALIGKAAHYSCAGASPRMVGPGSPYVAMSRLPARQSMVRSEQLAGIAVQAWAAQLRDLEVEDPAGISIDEFNYCQNAGLSSDDSSMLEVDDLRGLDPGIEIHDLTGAAERVRPVRRMVRAARLLGPQTFHEWFGGQSISECVVDRVNDAVEVESRLRSGTHKYLYASEDVDPAELDIPRNDTFYFDAGPGLELQFAMRFLDGGGEPLGSTVFPANVNQVVDVPTGTAAIRPGIRIAGAGIARVKGLVLGRRQLEPPVVVGRGRHLVLTDHYPTYDDLYRNAFVHRRVAAYRRHDLDVDVFRLRPSEAISYHEFDNVDCITGSQSALDRILASGQYQTVMVHFLSKGMWEVLQRHVDRLGIIVWVHGSEVQPWHRRMFNFTSESKLKKAKEQSEKRIAFWSDLLEEMPPNLKLVFVSNYFAEEVMSDLGVKLSPDHYRVIHNPVDTDLFKYCDKPVDQRKRILSIRPYASRKYANDLSVKAILHLSELPGFEDLDFRMIGEGPLFEEVTEPLRGLPNVTLERRFMKQTEIAEVHREYGIFLTPTRMDAQGVSRDEAMSSGLVPITNHVAAIPEFVDESCGIAVPPEDFKGLADGIVRLVEDPGLFSRLSHAAAQRVRAQSAADRVIEAEISLIRDSAGH